MSALRRCPSGGPSRQGGQDPQEARHQLQQNRDAASTRLNSKSPPKIQPIGKLSFPRGSAT
jgi:hypothetical protein